ncbi:MAG: AAA family ATPase [Bdellovibrionales bacterium]|nr:AAA family ATPase [Bdellovibrionales bacterium]
MEDFQAELDICLRARFTLLVAVTREEERLLKAMKGLCEKRSRPLYTWDSADGFKTLIDDTPAPGATLDPLAALSEIERAETNGVYVLLDFHDAGNHPTVKRKLRSLAQSLKYTKKSIIISSPYSQFPEELKDVAVTIDFPLPSERELSAVLDTMLKTPGAKIEVSDKEREEIVRAARGLTASQAQRVFARAIVNDGRLDRDDIQVVIDEKKAIIKESEALDYYPTNIGLENVGGLEVLKEWLKLRTKAFSEEAKAYGIEDPKGVALIGIPGTGKSLSAKMIASMWMMPLLRLDIGAMFNQFYGQSEERTRRALKIAEAVAPCVLWIDEIEKGLGGGYGEGQTTQRVFGTILTWMQEKTSPCFVVATANDVALLPPELLRKGRFDEVFFLDLPTRAEREAIFKVHLKKRRRDPEQFDTRQLAEDSAGYVGAEIEQAIVDAMVVGFNQGREFTTNDIIETLKRQVPLSVAQKEKIGALQEWLDQGRAQPASRHEGDSGERERLKRQLGFG